MHAKRECDDLEQLHEVAVEFENKCVEHQKGLTVLG